MMRKRRINPAASVLILACIVGFPLPHPCWAHKNRSERVTENCASLRLSVAQNARELASANTGSQDLSSASNLVVFLKRMAGEPTADPAQTLKAESLRRELQREQQVLQALGCESAESDLPTNR